MAWLQKLDGSRMMRFLLPCVRGRANLVLSGIAGSGKTMLGVLTAAIRRPLPRSWTPWLARVSGLR